MAVQILRATTAACIDAVDTPEEARELARQAGADLVLPSDESTATEIRRFTAERGAEAVLTASAPPSGLFLVNETRRGGHGRCRLVSSDRAAIRGQTKSRPSRRLPLKSVSGDVPHIG